MKPRLYLNPTNSDAEGKAAVYLQIIIDRKKKLYPTGVKWAVAHWDRLEKTIKPSSKNDPDYGPALVKIQSCIEKAIEVFRLSMLRKETLTLESFDLEYTNFDRLNVSRNDFMSFCFIEAEDRWQRGEIVESTYKAQLTRFKKLQAFQKEIPFTQLTTSFILAFDQSLKKKKNGAAHNYRVGIHKTIGTYISIAIDRGLMQKNPYRDRRFKGMDYVEGEYQPLTSEDIQKLEEYHRETLNQSHSAVLSAFLWAFYTCGMRFSDVSRISEESIIGDTLCYIPYKNRRFGKQVRIPLTAKAKQFIKDILKSGKLIKTYTEPYTNRVLKDIAKVLGIKKNLSTHLARVSFATMFLENGGDVGVLNKLLGHSKFEQTMKYVRLRPEKVQQQIEDFQKKIAG